MNSEIVRTILGKKLIMFRSYQVSHQELTFSLQGQNDRDKKRWDKTDDTSFWSELHCGEASNKNQDSQ